MKSMKKTGYKVVRKLGNGHRFSCVMSASRVRYLLGRLIRPRNGCGALSVFHTFEDAKRFVINYCGGITRRQTDWIIDFEIFKIKYIPADNPRLWRPGRRMNMRHAPAGTRCADKLWMGVKPVWSYNEDFYPRINITP